MIYWVKLFFLKCLGLFVLLIFIACNNTTKEEERNILKELPKQEQKKILEASLKQAFLKEELQIQGWIMRSGKVFNKSTTGVYTHQISIGDTSGSITAGTIVQLNYTLSLLNGDTIHNEWDQLTQVKVAFDHKESGLHEALQSMHPNTEAIVIIPSHRAHGLVGDDKKIPPLSTIIYHLKIVDL